MYHLRAQHFRAYHFAQQQLSGGVVTPSVATDEWIIRARRRGRR